MFESTGREYLYYYDSEKVASGDYIDLFLNSQQVLMSFHSFVEDTLLDSSELVGMVILT